MWPTLGKTISKSIRPVTITVEGNIGSGKTTFLKYFAERDKNVLILAEPVAKWRNLHGYNLLNMMYHDPKKWGFTFQTYVQLTMLQMHSYREAGKQFKMMERSLHSAMRCFVENLYLNGIMETEQKLVLDEWYKWLLSQGMLDMDLIIYLRGSPETALRRIQQRGRREEVSSVSLDLLQNLHRLHEQWLCNAKVPASAPVLVIDAEQPLEKMLSQYDRVRDILESGLTMRERS